MVPSAIPAASAIWRVVTISPCSSSSGTVAATIIERRSSGGMAGARVEAGVTSAGGTSVFGIPAPY